MNRKQSLLILWVLLSTVLSGMVESSASAEWVCNSEVYYKWRKNEGEESRIFWSKHERRAPTEAEARGKLERVLTEQGTKSRAECRREHENLSGCIAVKLGAGIAVAPVTGSFATRQELEKAVTSDCKELQGKCLELEAPEVKCTEIKVQEAVAEGEKKEEKGKAKSKKK